MTIPDAILQQLNADLHGQPAWGLTRGIGSFLDVELGPAQLGSDDAPRGTWHLWVYMCDWRIEQAGVLLVGSNDLPELIDETLGGLGPLTVESFQVDPGTGDTELRLAEGVRLAIFASALPTDDSEAWTLRQPDGSVLAGGPGTRWAMETAR